MSCLSLDCIADPMCGYFQLTLILSVKRHHQRFFVPEAATARAGATVPNIPAGCVVDSFVTDPRG